MKRIDHSQAYSFDGAYTNQAEEYFSRLRRAEIGIHHHIAGAYLLRYAQESSWRDRLRNVIARQRLFCPPECVRNEPVQLAVAEQLDPP